MDLGNLDDLYDIISNQKQLTDDLKIIYDIFSTYFIYAITEDKNREKILNELPRENARKLVEWFTSFTLPFYEKKEDFEKCAKLKEAIVILKRVKNLA